MITPATNTQTCQTSYTNAQCSAQFQSAHYAQNCTTSLSGSATSTPCYGALQASTFASSSAQPQFDVQQWQAKPSSAPPQQLHASCIPFSHRRALSYAHHPQFQARESLCQDLFNVGTADPSTNHVLKSMLFII